jgi:hypothetical protein
MTAQTQNSVRALTSDLALRHAGARDAFGCDDDHTWRECEYFALTRLRGICHTMYVISPTYQPDTDQTFSVADFTTDGPVRLIESDTSATLTRGFISYQYALLWATQQIVVEQVENDGGAERIEQPEGDWLLCKCGNSPDRDGFVCSTPTGVVCEPDAPDDADAPDWDGEHYVCLNCDRIVSQNTLLVLGQRVGGVECPRHGDVLIISSAGHLSCGCKQQQG